MERVKEVETLTECITQIREARHLLRQALRKGREDQSKNNEMLDPLDWFESELQGRVYELEDSLRVSLDKRWQKDG